MNMESERKGDSERLIAGARQIPLDGGIVPGKTYKIQSNGYMDAFLSAQLIITESMAVFAVTSLGSDRDLWTFMRPQNSSDPNHWIIRNVYYYANFGETLAYLRWPDSYLVGPNSTGAIWIANPNTLSLSLDVPSTNASSGNPTVLFCVPPLTQQGSLKYYSAYTDLLDSGNSVQGSSLMNLIPQP